MPRNSAGTYTLPGGINPVASGTVISANWANPTFADIADVLSSSLDRDGNGGMLAPFLNADGTVGAPGVTWSSETDSGWYRNAANDVRAAINGVVTTQHRDDTGSTAGEQHPFRIWDGSAFYNPLTTDDGATPSFTAITASTGLTISAGNLTVSTVGATITGNSTIGGDLDVTGDFDMNGTYPDYDYGYDRGADEELYWGIISSTGTIVLDGNGISSVSKTGTGQYKITFDANIRGNTGGDDKCVAVNVMQLSGGEVNYVNMVNDLGLTADQAEIIIQDRTAAVDATFCIIAAKA